MKSHMTRSGSESAESPARSAAAIQRLKKKKKALTSAFPTAASVRSSNKHFTAASRIFNAGPALMKEPSR